MGDVSIRRADLSSEADQQAIVELIDAYARDPMGRGQPLTDEVKQRLIPGLQTHPTSLIFLAVHKQQPIGIALCFIGFSSFKARRLTNIHDLAVLPEYRGKGIGTMLLQAVEQDAEREGHCAITLEVDEVNQRALKTYLASGYEGERQGVANGRTFFMKKLL